MATYFRPLILTAGRNKSAYFSRRDDSKLTANRTLSQLYVDREAAERAIERYRKRYPMDEIVYSEIEEVDGSRESNPARRGSDGPIFGHEWEDIQRAQQRGRLSRTIDTSKPATAPSTEDRKLLAQYGSLEALEAAGFYGSADKLRNARESNPDRKPTIYEDLRTKLGREPTRASGRPEPSDVRMGRGYQINVRDMTFSFGKNDAVTRVK